MISWDGKAWAEAQSCKHALSLLSSLNHCLTVASQLCYIQILMAARKDTAKQNCLANENICVMTPGQKWAAFLNTSISWTCSEHFRTRRHKLKVQPDFSFRVAPCAETVFCKITGQIFGAQFGLVSPVNKQKLFLFFLKYSAFFLMLFIILGWIGWNRKKLSWFTEKKVPSRGRGTLHLSATNSSTASEEPATPPQNNRTLEESWPRSSLPRGEFAFSPKLNRFPQKHEPFEKIF